MAGVLITGFGPFPGAPVNPTEALVAGLARRATARGIAVRAEVLATEYAAAEVALPALLAEADPDVVLHFGLSARARTLRIERRARNRAAIARPDASGAMPNLAIIEPGGPANRSVTLPVARALAALARVGLAAAPSLDAGDYLCNYVLYRSLAASAGRRRVVGFVHVPPPVERHRLAGPAAMSADDLLAGGAIILDVALAASRAGL